MTRGRHANDVDTAPPAFELDQHGPVDTIESWTPEDALIAAIERQSGETSAIARRRELRDEAADRPRCQ